MRGIEESNIRRSRYVDTIRAVLARGIRIARFVAAVYPAMLMALAGCAYVPTAGPTTAQVLDQVAVDNRWHFDLVNVDDHVISVLRSEPAPSLQTRFGKDGKPPTAKIGIGDAISVTIYEDAVGGLLAGASAAPGVAPASGLRSVTIPDQVVAPDGAISVPYGGRVQVASRTPLQVQQAIERRLAERAVAPEVIVTVTKSVSKNVTVSGAGVSGAPVPLTEHGERLLDVIAAAGGVKSPLYETFVRLSRGQVTESIPMDKLVSYPEENIYAWPADVITLVQVPQTFSVFGATTSNSELSFGADRLNLAQAIAKAGGLQDQRADPQGVFLFRFEALPIVRALSVRPIASAGSDASPILYHLDLQNVDGYFLAQRFPVKGDDLIYVANASMTNLQKFFTLVGTITGPIASGILTGQSLVSTSSGVSVGVTPTVSSH